MYHVVDIDTGRCLGWFSWADIRYAGWAHGGFPNYNRTFGICLWEP